MITSGIAPATVVQRLDYFPFGENINLPDSTGNSNAVFANRNLVPSYNAGTVGPLQFTGKERDSETGLDYFGARYFASAQGRFSSPDDFFKDSHVADPQSWHKYAYARNNPLRYVDPNGENATVTTSCSTNNQNQTTCNVNVSASIAIYAESGSGITQDQLKAAASTIQSIIQSAWAGSFTSGGITYNVTTQVSVPSRRPNRPRPVQGPKT